MDRGVLCSSVARHLRGNMRVVESRSAGENAGQRLKPRSGFGEPSESVKLDTFRIGDFRHVLQADMCY